MSGKSSAVLPAPRPRGRWWMALGLAALTLALFWPATGYDFINYDDDHYVSDNPMVRQGLTLRGVRWALTMVHEDWWLPMLWISYMLDTDLFGPAPFGYHLTNLLLHAANVALLLWVLSRLTGSVWRSAFVAALFAAHPLRLEAVAWITARKDVLSGLFFMLGLLAYVPYVERPSLRRFWPLPVLMLLGLMSKAILIIFPFVLLLLDYWPLRRAGDPWNASGWKQWRPLLLEKLPLVGLAMIFIVINLRTHYAGAGEAVDVPLMTRWGLIFPNYWAYLQKTFWPTRLALLYPEHDVVNWPLSMAALLGLAAVTLLFVRLRRTCPCLIVGWLWFLLALFPVIRGVRLGLAAYADRFTYLPSIGLGLAVTWGAADLLSRRRSGRALAWALGLAVLAGCAWQTRATLPRWENSITVFTNILNYAPDNPLANNNLGAYYASLGRRDEALTHLRRCLDAKPDYADAHINLANLYLGLRRTDDAIRHYRAVLEINPNHVKALNNLAWLLATGPGPVPAEREESLRLARRAAGLVPAPDPGQIDTLAAAYAANGRFDEAARTAMQALQGARTAGDEELARRIEQRLDSYRRGQPWKD